MAARTLTFAGWAATHQCQTIQKTIRKMEKLEYETVRRVGATTPKRKKTDGGKRNRIKSWRHPKHEFDAIFVMSYKWYYIKEAQKSKIKIIELVDQLQP